MQERNFILKDLKHYGQGLGLLILTPEDGAPLPQIMPGQFAQILTHAQGVTLRRPISISDVQEGEIHLFVRDAGRGTHWMLTREKGDIFNLILPLGKGFTIAGRGEKVLLVGGGAGAAPLLLYARRLRERGAEVNILIGAKTDADFVMKSEFEALGDVAYTTEDGSAGVKGFVTNSPMIKGEYDLVACCGPTPMMKAVAKVVTASCEVSLENMMACGLGACLCCVEKTKEGNICVCKEGPVFNTEKLLW